MQGASSSRVPKNRQACEPCRRKKIKCTAERPNCSHCVRSQQQCLYLPREPPKFGIAINRKSSKDRVHRLEEQIGDLYNIIQTISENPSSSRSAGGEKETADLSSSPSHAKLCPVDNSVTNNGQSFSEACPEPPSHVVEHFVNVYISKVHLQPLPLFNPETLLNHLSASPRYLLWSFMAVALNFATHAFYKNEAQAITFYARWASESVSKLVADGITQTAIVQASCLLALRNVLSCNANKAWMWIGSAGRLLLLTNEITSGLSRLPNDDNFSRCFWSIYTLERTFSSKATQLSEKSDHPKCPVSSTIPPAVPVTSNGTHSPDFLDYDSAAIDLGINHYYLDMVTIWGKLLNYLHDLRDGKAEEPWTGESTHAKLNIELYERDVGLCPKHLLRNVNFASRSRDELLAHQQYWHPWLAMQIMSHAIPAILNHPFIHLSALRGGNSAPRSRIFLQQTVDTALLHSAWVARLLQTSDDLDIAINSPLIGEVLAATATICWLFQFTGDLKTGEKAAKNFKTHQAVLARLAVSWPYLTYKVEALRGLQAITDQKVRESTEPLKVVTFPSVTLWDILAPPMCQVMRGNCQTPETTSQIEHTVDTRLRVRTQYMHPLTDDQLPLPALSDPFASDTAPMDPQLGGLTEVSIDDLLTQFPDHGFYWDGS